MTIKMSGSERAYIAEFSPDGTKLLTCGDNGILWDTATAQRLLTLPRHEWGNIGVAAFSPNGRNAITGTLIYEAILWDLETGEAIHKFISPSVDAPYTLPGRIDGVAFSRDGRQVITGDTENILQIWDVQTGEEIQRYEHKTSGFFLHGFVLLPNGSDLIGGVGPTKESGFRIFDIETGETLPQHFEGMYSFSVSRDGKRVLTNGGRLYDVETGDLLHRFDVDSAHISNSVALSPDGKLAILGSASNGGRTYPRMIFNAEDGTLLRSHPLSGETGDPHSQDKQVLFAPDGKRYITINGDTNVYFWDISDLAAGVKQAEEYEKRE